MDERERKKMIIIFKLIKIYRKIMKENFEIIQYIKKNKENSDI